jgi:hypothetical protein
MKFSIQGKVYDAADLDLVSLRDILLFEQQTKDMGREITWSQIGMWSEEFDALKTDKEKQEHPAAPWMTAVTIWASRRIAGEDVTFDEAVDFPMRDLHFIAEPKDRKKPANPTRARPGSGRAAGPRAVPDADEPPSPETSEAASISG